MNKLITILFIFFLPISVNSATDTGTEADHEQLREMLVLVTEAINSGEPTQLDQYLHKDFAVTLMTQEVMTQQKPIKHYFDKWFNKEGSLIKSMMTDPEASIRTNIYDGKFGMVYGTTVDTYGLKDGREFSFNAGWTATLIKEENEWKLLALHVGVNPINNPLINGYRSWMGLGGVGIEIGRLFN